MTTPRSWLAAFSVYRDRRVVAVLLLGFSSGLPLSLTGQTLAYWLRVDGVSLTAIGLLASVTTPYALKFLWAPIMDHLRLPWLTRRFGRRRGWLLACQVSLMAAIVVLGSGEPTSNIWFIAILAFLVAFASASQDIVVDAYRVEICDDRNMAAGAAAYVLGYRIGMLLSGYGALYLADVLSWLWIYAVMAMFILVGMAAALFNREPERRVSADEARRTAALHEWLAARPDLSPKIGAMLGWFYVAVIGPFAEFVSRRGWLAILLFVMLYKFGDSLAGVMTTPLYVDLGFDSREIANVAKLYGTGATLVGLALGGWLMSAAGLYPSLWICGILQLLSNLAFAALAMAGADLSMLAFAVGVENLSGGMGTAAFVAYLSMLCNVSYTATQYALLTSFMAFARTVLSSSGGWLAEQLGWVTFFTATAAAAVPGLILLWWLTRQHVRSAK